MKLSSFVAVCTVIYPAASQSIQDAWQTTWDRSKLFNNVSPSTAIQFVTPSTAAGADIIVDDKTVSQAMYGFGGTLTDSSAKLLSNLKTQNSGNYATLMDDLFNSADGKATAGISYLRVALGASDFSATAYTFADNQDETLANFNIDAAPGYLFDTIRDIQAINPHLNVHVLPWSPPAWMKDSNNLLGGKLIDSHETTRWSNSVVQIPGQKTNDHLVANYLLKALQGFKTKGITAYAISIQNEPQNDNPTYPTCAISATQEAAIGKSLRALMDSNGFKDTKIIAFEHNWIDASAYPVTVMDDAADAFAGAAFHCYQGTYGEQADFHSKYPNKEIYFTECTGFPGTDWWSDIKWWMDNLFVGTTDNFASTTLLWNIALDGSGEPELPGSDSCNKPSQSCRGIVTVNSDGSYTLNQEYYTIAQNSRAITPKDINGPWGKKIGVSISGSENWALRVQAYATGRASSSDQSRYSLVVLNWDDSSSSTFKPVDVAATIEFRGVQASYTFPVGVTTLWWYAAAS